MTMKKYIFITYGIVDMGGGQMYVYNKTQYLKNNDYNVYVFSVFNGDVIIKGLEEYKDDIISELGVPIFYFSLSQKNKIINSIIKKIDLHFDDEIIIESNSISNALWGEKISALLHCKHFIYLLSENNLIYADTIYPFLKFKYNRQEVAAINEKIIPWLFQKYEEIGENKSYSLKAACTNVFEDYEHELIHKIPHRDYTIGMIGRLEKPYLLPILDDIIGFCNNHIDKTFTILLIGDTQDKIRKNRIIDKFAKSDNINLVLSGYLYPIPLRLLDLCDVFVSSAGSAFLTEALGYLTISIDGKDYKPTGILGYTTDNSLFRNNEPIVEINDLLEDILILEKYPKRLARTYDTSINDFSNKTHMDFIANSDQSEAYYNIDSVRPTLLYRYKKIIYIIKQFSRYVLGNSTYSKLAQVKRSLLHT